MDRTLSSVMNFPVIWREGPATVPSFGLNPAIDVSVLPARQPMKALVKKAKPDPSVALQQLVQETYDWANPQHKAAALEHLEGLVIAAQHGLLTQVQLYHHKIKELITRDVVMKVAAQYPQSPMAPFTYNHSFPPTNEFAASFALAGDRQKRWEFHRINNFNKLIPPPALHTLAALYEAGIVPDDLWVAEEQQQIDPILFASFGCSFVALAVWL